MFLPVGVEDHAGLMYVDRDQLRGYHDRALGVPSDQWCET